MRMKGARRAINMPLEWIVSGFHEQAIKWHWDVILV